MKKLSLKDLRVKSFVTQPQKSKVVGGGTKLDCASIIWMCETGQEGCISYINCTGILCE